MFVPGSPVNTMLPIFKPLFLASFLLIWLLPLDAVAGPNAGFDNRCQDIEYIKVCPQTCAAKCDNVDSSAGIAACIDVFRKVRDGAKDQPSCKVRKPAAAENSLLMDELRSRCVSLEFARDCPETCDRLCTQDNLKGNQIDACRQILKALTNGAKDRDSCRRHASNYDSCKKRVANFFKDFQVPPRATPGSIGNRL
uniref:Uncharacterized protein n=1 Tax=Candidatus Kentrum sp. LPFa TaxID=2126335 RepID=A0A450XYH6_9GAMM|nr:MAG: hypothetical protein BECKLPF1236A_GA0070988_102316 [Candidatus Kentron sp. LPFa]VFK34348.1 MAG: hypothetical protein BECKLPF1236C_GA0070990_102626 [Candidatus Kentron sp. LPFa]